MIHELSPERLALLQEYGFGESPDCDLLGAFSLGDLALDTHMEVEGEHATDHAYIYYAVTEDREGLFYAPSLLEGMLLAFSGEWNPKSLLPSVNAQLDGEVEYVFVGGFPMFYLPVTEYDWKYDFLRSCVSDMLKVVARLDYLLPRKNRSLMKGRKE